LEGKNSRSPTEEENITLGELTPETFLKLGIYDSQPISVVVTAKNVAKESDKKIAAFFERLVRLLGRR
jgi:hypothetical protein